MSEHSDPDDAPATATPPAGATSSANVGWHSDPTHRFELRYHNGRTWTADVARDGERFVDPGGARPSPPTAASVVPAAAPGPPTPVAAGPGSTRHPTNPAATASMVLGIIAVGIGWMPVIVVVGAIAAVLAITLGVIGRRRAQTRDVGSGFAVAGLVLGCVALLVCVLGVLFTASLFRAIDRFENPSANTTTISACERADGTVTAAGSVTNTGPETASFTVRVEFVRPGTDNARHRATVQVDDVPPGAVAEFATTVRDDDLELDCTISAVRGPLPYGIDPGT